MNLRKLTGLACVLALSGCATYDYVGAGYGSYEGGDYYSGAPVTEYHYEGYGYPYYSYYPGISLGVRYGYPWYGRYPGYYVTPAYPTYVHRPPVHRPPHSAGGRPEGHRPPQRPPQHGKPGTARPRDGAPWRDLDRLRRDRERADDDRRGPRPVMQPQSAGTYRAQPQGNPQSRPVNTQARPGQVQPMRPGRVQQVSQNQQVRQRPAGTPAPVYRPQAQPQQGGRPVVAAPRPAPQNRGQPSVRPAPRAEARPAAPRPSAPPPRAERPARTETHRTQER